MVTVLISDTDPFCEHDVGGRHESNYFTGSTDQSMGR